MGKHAVHPSMRVPSRMPVCKFLFGDIACFSFDGIKNITSGEGGCVVTNDHSVIKKISDARLLGVENDSEKRASGKRSWDFDVKCQGWRYHMSDIMAAIGIVQLKRYPELALKRKKIAKTYDLLLAKSEYISPLLHNIRFCLTCTF